MKRLKLWFAAALLSTAPLALADPPAQVGRLNFLQGTVSFAPAEANTDWAVAPLNRPVTTGDRLWADRDGRAEFRVGPNAMRIAAMTSLDVLRLDDEVTHLRLAQGTLLVRLRRLDAGDSFEISTPSGAVLLTRPGLYRITVDGSGMPTTVLVREGQADVLTGNAPLSLNANQYVTLSTADPAFGTARGVDEFERWAYARDNPQQPVAATRYVHPDMTGHEDLDHHGTWQAEPQYGNVWIPTAAALPVGWAPYRYGRWVWVSPWGWTWVDNAPWGFAPYHYGRWVWLGQRWAWAPGPRAPRPVYAPALVAFVGGHNWSVSVASGPSVAWVPLGWREPYIPWYRHSPRYVRNVNVTHVTNVTVINQYTNVSNVTRVRYVNRDVPTGTTVVTRDTFVRARHVHEARLDAPVRTLAAAQVTHAAPVTRPERQSLIATQPGTRLPAAVAAREVIAAREPAPVARLAPEGAAANERRAAREEERPRVRVLQAQQGGRQTRPDATAGDKRQDGAPVLGIAPQGAPSNPGHARKADGIAEKTPTRADTKAGDDKQRKPTVAMPPGERERIIAREKATADQQATGDAQQKTTATLPPGERARSTERLAEKAQPRTETRAGDDAPKKPAVAMPPGERERAKTTLETKGGDTQQKPIVAVPPGDRMRTLADTKADTKAAGEEPRPPVATLAPADAQRLQQLQQQQQEALARARQEKQAQDQKQQQDRAAAAQQQQERQAREAREREAQQQQAHAVRQKQLQQQQEQQRALAGQQQQERALQQQAAQQQQERQAQQAREEQQRQLQQQRLLQQQQAVQQQQERQAREAREEQQRQARAQQQRLHEQQAAQRQREQQAQLVQQQAEHRRGAAERQQRRAPDNPEQPQGRNKPKPQPEFAPPQGR